MCKEVAEMFCHFFCFVLFVKVYISERIKVYLFHVHKSIKDNLRAFMEMC